MIKYKKLVSDKIPDIIKASGDDCNCGKRVKKTERKKIVYKKRK